MAHFAINPKVYYYYYYLPNIASLMIGIVTMWNGRTLDGRTVVQCFIILLHPTSIAFFRHERVLLNDPEP